MTTSFEHDSPRLAQTYDRVSDFQFDGGKRLVERLALKAGDRVLDVGCGTGRLTRWIAELVGPEGRVVGIDPLPERIALARAHGAGLHFEVGQAEDLGAFADASFDAVSMSAVFHWVADKSRALAEIRRVLRPGGRLGATTVTPELVRAGDAATVILSVLGRSPYVQQVNPSGFALARGGPTTTELISLLIDNRLDLAELAIRTRIRRHGSGKDVVDFLEASSFGTVLLLVPEELRPSLRTDLERAFESRRGDEGVVLRDWGSVFVAVRV